MKALFDTNMLIDFLNGIPAAKKELDLYQTRVISVVTWMEVMSGGDPVHDAVTRAFLNGFSIVSVTDAIAERAVKLRRERRIKLPDAIILATSLEQGLMLVTRNSKDFGAKLPGVRNPYRL